MSLVQEIKVPSNYEIHCDHFRKPRRACIFHTLIIQKVQLKRFLKKKLGKSYLGNVCLMLSFVFLHSMFPYILLQISTDCCFTTITTIFRYYYVFFSQENPPQIGRVMIRGHEAGSLFGPHTKSCELEKQSKFSFIRKHRLLTSIWTYSTWWTGIAVQVGVITL